MSKVKFVQIVTAIGTLCWIRISSQDQEVKGKGNRYKVTEATVVLVYGIITIIFSAVVKVIIKKED